MAKVKKYYDRVLRVWKAIAQNITKEELEIMLEEDVFSNLDFKREIIEVSLKLKIDEKTVLKVVKHYILILGYQMIRITNFKRRLVIFGFFNLDIHEPIYNEYSEFYEKKVQEKFPFLTFRKIKNRVKRINNYKKKKR